MRLGLLAALLLAVALVAGIPTGAQAQTTALVSNLGQADGGYLGLVPSDRAQAFTTGSNSTGYTLDSADVEFAALSDSEIFSTKLTAAIHSDSSGAPGTVVGTLTNPAYRATSSDMILNFAAPAGGIELAARTTYWLVLDSDGTLQGNNRLRSTASDSEDGRSASGFSIVDTSSSRPATNTGSAWTSVAESKKISINGNANALPPPPPPALVSNLGQADGLTQSFANDYAQAFTTGGNNGGYTLDSVDVRFANLVDPALFSSKLTAAIHSDSGGAPGAPGARVGALTNPAYLETTTDRNYTFTAPGGIRLDADTTYWLVLDVTGDVEDIYGRNRLRSTRSDSEDAGAASGFSIADRRYQRSYTANTWTQSLPHSLMLAINGSENAPLLVSNLGQGDGNTQSFAWDNAQAFTTGDNVSGYILDSFDVRFASLADSALFTSKLTATVNSDSGGAPGTAVATLTNPAFEATTTDRDYTFTAPAGGIRLDANTTYWLVLDATGGVSAADNLLRTASSDNEDAESASGFSIGNNIHLRSATTTDNTWISSGFAALKIRINGNANPPPLVSNLGQADGSSGSLRFSDWAQAFTTGDNSAGYTLDGVDVEFATLNDTALFTSKLTATISSTDSSGAPGAAVATLTNPDFEATTTDRNYTFAAPAGGIPLAANTTYWLVLDVTSPAESNNNVRFTTTGSEDAGAASGWNIGDRRYHRSYTASAWVSGPVLPLKIGVNGSENPPPPLLVSNLGRADGGEMGFAVDYAQAFTTGGSPSGYTLDSVDVEFAKLGHNTFLATALTTTINSDSGGAPGAVAATLTNPAYLETTTDRNYNFAAPAGGIQLDANTTYWLVLDHNASIDGSTALRGTASDDEDDESASGFSIADTRQTRPYTSTGTDWASREVSMKLGLNGRVTPGIAQAVTLSWSDSSGTLPTIIDEGRSTYTGEDGMAGGNISVRFTLDRPAPVGGTDLGDLISNVENGELLLEGRSAIVGAGLTFAEYPIRAAEDSRDTLDRTLTYTYPNDPGFELTPDSGQLTLKIRDNDPTLVDLIAPESTPRRSKGQTITYRVRLSRALVEGEIIVAPLQVEGGNRLVRVKDRVAVDRVALNYKTALNTDADNMDADNMGVTLGNGADDIPYLTFSGAGARDAVVDFMPLTDADLSTLLTELLADPERSMLLTAEDRSMSIEELVNKYKLSDGATLTVRLLNDFSFHDEFHNTNVDGGAAPVMSGGNPKGFSVNVYDAVAYVQFRTCTDSACATTGDPTGEGDPPPPIKLAEGGSSVTYQYRLEDPADRDFFVKSVQPARAEKYTGYIGAGEQDTDRFICHSPRARGYSDIGAKLANVPRPDAQGGGFHPGQVRPHDATNGCPFTTTFIYEHNVDDWHTVTISSGHDPDAYDHHTHLVHSVSVRGQNGQPAGFEYETARLPIWIEDDDEWEQDLEISTDGGTTWTKVAAGGLEGALQGASLTAGATHTFQVRLSNSNPAGDTQTVSIHSCTGTLRTSNKVTVCEAPGLHRAMITHNGLHGTDPRSLHSFLVSHATPITVNIHVDDDFEGNVHFRVEAPSLYARTDTDMPSHSAAPTDYRTGNFTYFKRFTSCVGCPVGRFIGLRSWIPSERLIGFSQGIPSGGEVGDLTATDLSDGGVRLSWPWVSGAEAYEVRWWSTTSPWPGVPAEEAYVGALVTGTSHALIGLEPNTEYRARVYYVAGGGAALDSGSPTIRFTTLAAGSPTQANPTSPVLERTPVASIAPDAPSVNEGEEASFTVTLNPAPAAPREVTVDVAQHSARGSTVAADQLGRRTVTVPTSGSVRFTVATQDDTWPDENGLLSADVVAGEGYRVSRFDSHAVMVINNDDAPAAEVTTIGVKQVTDTTATIVWAPQGDGAQYQVGWYQTIGIPRLQYAATSETEHRITGLEPKTPYQVFVVASRNGAIIRTYTVKVTTLAGGETKDAEVEVTLPPATPVVSVSAGSGVTEGSDASFTVTADPAPASNLKVSVTVSQSGDYGASTGQRTVTIPPAGSVTLTVSTVNDDANEADGSVTARVAAGYGYTVSATQGSATVSVSDDDNPEVSISAGNGVTEGGDASFTVTADPVPASSLDVSVTVSQRGDYGAATGERTVTIPTAGSVTLTVGTTNDGADEADGSVTATLNAGSGYRVSASQGAATVSVADDDVPEVSISAGNGVTEGGDATFTVTANPAPAASLDVSVTVSQRGDYGAATGSRTVTIPTAGSVTLTVGTTDDGADEADGSVTATVNSGSGYTVSSSQGAATVSVTDDDVPEVSISAGNGVTEGGDATFTVTVTASPAPAANLGVSVTVSQSGDYGAATGQQTVTIPPAGSVTLTVGTSNDGTDEADGSVTATVNAGSSYTVSSSQGAATVSVADDDVPVDPVIEPEDEFTVTVEDASGMEGDVVEFRILLSHALTEEFEVRWFAGPAYHLLDDRAHSGDYQAMSEVMVFAPGETELTGVVWLNDDDKEEPDEYFAVEAYLPGEWFTPVSVGTMTIVDDD